MSCVSLHALELVNCRKIRFRSKNWQKLAIFCSKSAKVARFTITFLRKCDSKFFEFSTNFSPRIQLSPAKLLHLIIVGFPCLAKKGGVKRMI